MRKSVTVLIIFSIAMAALESAVVVYLRALYYPEGFSVVLKITDNNILAIEVARELATVIMLWGIGYLTGSNFKERFAYFLLSFAIWDIFYYVWLKVFIDWPSTILEWDILFLIPVTWLGPVLAPVICSFTMMLMAFILLSSPVQKTFFLGTKILIGLGSLLILWTFMKDYGALMMERGFTIDKEFMEIATRTIPDPFSWWVFAVGELLILSALFFYFFKPKPIVY